MTAVMLTAVMVTYVLRWRWLLDHCPLPALATLSLPQTIGSEVFGKNIQFLIFHPVLHSISMKYLTTPFIYMNICKN